MQLLFAASDEEDTPCLGIIDAHVRLLAQGKPLPVPQMGWNALTVVRESKILDGIADGAYAYFVHSYAAPCNGYTRAVADYGGPFAAVVEQRNFFGTQFHPERSARVGARILENFLKIPS
jgi:glutamine amidotransferase